MMKVVEYLCLVTLLVGCFGGADTPEEALSVYIQTVTTNKADRDFYLQYTSGKLLQQIESMNDEDFKEFNNFENIKSAKVKVIYKSCELDRCSLTYTVSYEVHENNKVNFDTEVKKIAELVKIENSWKISEVSNRKTYIESKSAIDISNKK